MADINKITDIDASTISKISDIDIADISKIGNDIIVPPPPPPPEPINTLLLIHSNTFNGSTIFTDSARDHTITPTNVTHNTSRYKFPPSSISFPGSGTLAVQNSADWSFGSSDWTIESFVRRTTADSGYRLLWRTGGVNAVPGIFFGLNSGIIYFQATTGNDAIYADVDPLTPDVFYHIAAVRHGSNVYIYRNGTRATTLTPTNINTIFNRTEGPTIGEGFYGHFEEIRVSNIARYTESSYTIPTSEFSVD